VDQSLTSVSLLLRIGRSRNDETAWREFVERYGSRIYSWCLNRKLPPTDAEDVTQNVLMRLAQKLEEFEYDSSQSFRGWLRRITENAITDYVRARRQDQAKGGSSVILLMAEEPARIELADYLAEAFDLELLDEAKSRTRLRVNDSRWQSWDLTANHNMTGKEVAEKLGISVGNVYANKNQVQKLIREEIERLEKLQEWK
jgi:RNA polymerase sigma-70 factor (ECF subfamily)